MRKESNMNKRESILATLVVTLAAVAAAGSWIWWKSHTPKAVARELVRSQLKEPGTVRFDSLREDPRSKAVCGLLQTRDSTGHYVRTSSFVALPGGPVWLEPADNSETSLFKSEAQRTDQKQVFAKLKAALCPDF
jgi:hypothetical protein